MAPFGVVSPGVSIGCGGPCRGLNWRGMACTGSSLVPTGDGEEVIPSRWGMRTSLRTQKVKTGRGFILPQTAPLIVHVGGLNEVVLRWCKALECSMERRGCVPAVAPMLKLVEIRMWGFRE